MKLNYENRFNIIIRLPVIIDNCGFLQGNFSWATDQLRKCLASLGRPLPTSKLELVSGLSWNFLRQLLHRLVGKWMFNKPSAVSSKDDVNSSAKNAALVYHKLNQLHLAGN